MDQVVDAVKTIDEVLEKLIDEWYEKVSGFYVTRATLKENPDAGQEELKRFHDENGHRIKFSKHELDVTYGLRAYEKDELIYIEVSVNNKVEDFNYEDFRKQLQTHYRRTGHQPVPTPYELRNHTYDEVFQLDSNFRDAFKVEIREDRADIMGLSFQLNPSYIDHLLAHPVSCKDLVENYCVTPFRTIYASVYRNS